MSTVIGQTSSSMDALLDKYTTVSNNIANASTTGFKRTLSLFSTKLDAALSDKAKETLGSEEVEGRQVIDFSAGQIVRTDNSMDVALNGGGFLTLETPNGLRYTRGGTLNVNTLGQLVDAGGRIVAGQNGPVVIPRDTPVEDVKIASDGTVSTLTGEIGKLKLVEFNDVGQELTPAGYGTFQAADDTAAQPATKTKIVQGFQESSNVKVMDEMVNLMTLSRIYEMNVNVLKRRGENSSAVLGVASGS